MMKVSHLLGISLEKLVLKAFIIHKYYTRLSKLSIQFSWQNQIQFVWNGKSCWILIFRFFCETQSSKFFTGSTEFDKRFSQCNGANAPPITKEWILKYFLTFSVKADRLGKITISGHWKSIFDVKYCRILLKNFHWTTLT